MAKRDFASLEKETRRDQRGTNRDSDADPGKMENEKRDRNRAGEQTHTRGRQEGTEVTTSPVRRGFAAMDEQTRREISRKGGETVAREYGPEFYREIGRKGGETVARERGPEFYQEIGRKGGRAVSEDRAHMSTIGREGGRSRGRHFEEEDNQGSRFRNEGREKDAHEAPLHRNHDDNSAEEHSEPRKRAY